MSLTFFFAVVLVGLRTGYDVGEEQRVWACSKYLGHVANVSGACVSPSTGSG